VQACDISKLAGSTRTNEAVTSNGDYLGEEGRLDRDSRALYCSSALVGRNGGQEAVGGQLGAGMGRWEPSSDARTT